MNDGGPAFPRTTTDAADGSSGMSLRDYFAAHAMVGLLQIPALESESQMSRGKLIAKYAYGFADALLDQREKKGR